MSDETQRIVVTGFGVISSIGSGREGYLAGLRAGLCGADRITGWDSSEFEYANGYEVRDFDPFDVLEVLTPDTAGRVASLAAAAARMALADAALPVADVRRAPTLVAVGNTTGESWELDALGAAEAAGVPASRAGLANGGRLSTAAATELGLSDVETVTISGACAAGNYAVGYGMDALRAGEVDYALCGGSDTVNRMLISGFIRMGALATERCRPFDVNRNGVMWGEGAAVLVLETLAHARQRGATIHGEVLGMNLNCDAFHPTAPVGERVAQNLAGALANSGVDASEVDAIFAHATSTKANDPMEVQALRDVWGERELPPVIGVKSMIGHTQGAVGAHTAIAALLAMKHGFLPPTVGLEELDPECAVDCVPNEARPADVRTVLVNSLGFAGYNAAVVLRRFEEAS